MAKPKSAYSIPTKKGKLELYLEFGNFLNDEDQNEIRKCIICRGKRVPLQHILGKINFSYCSEVLVF